MNLQNLVGLAEIINALAVTLTLVVLVISIRQNTNAQRVGAVQSLSAAIAAINVPAMDSPALGSALSRALHDWNAATRDERILAHYFLFSYFKLIETAWYQRNAGALEAEQWEGWEWMVRLFFHSDGVRLVWWPHRCHAFSPAFRNYLELSEPPADARKLDDLFGA
jgi:hypothetical protein